MAAAQNAYVIFRLSSDRDLRNQSPYERVAVYLGRTAREALTRFAADRDIEIGDGPADGKHWLQGRKHLYSFGQGQFHADKTTLPANIEAAV
jgi:hypothetical protein